MTTDKFYVYDLIDPRTGCVFYVGKGSGNRIDAHEREAYSGVPSEKCDKIRSVLAAGLNIGKRIVETFDCEDAAYAAEKARINAIGIENLTNRHSGGRIKFQDKEYAEDRKTVRAGRDFMVNYLWALLNADGDTDRVEFLFCEQWHKVPADLANSVLDRLFEIKGRRGSDWFNAVAFPGQPHSEQRCNNAI